MSPRRHHQQHCRRRSLFGPGTAILGVVAENYYSGYYSQSITLPQRHTHTHTETGTADNTGKTAHNRMAAAALRQRATL